MTDRDELDRLRSEVERLNSEIINDLSRGSTLVALLEKRIGQLGAEVERLGRELVETGAALAECNAERERLKEELYLAKCFLRGCCEALGA